MFFNNYNYNCSSWKHRFSPKDSVLLRIFSDVPLLYQLLWSYLTSFTPYKNCVTLCWTRLKRSLNKMVHEKWFRVQLKATLPFSSPNNIFQRPFLLLEIFSIDNIKPEHVKNVHWEKHLFNSVSFILFYFCIFVQPVLDLQTKLSIIRRQPE